MLCMSWRSSNIGTMRKASFPLQRGYWSQSLYLSLDCKFPEGKDPVCHVQPYNFQSSSVNTVPGTHWILNNYEFNR